MKENTLDYYEITVTQMALTQLIEDNESILKDPTINFTPEARTMGREILTWAKSALTKLQAASGHKVQLDPYVEGDEKQFLTKES